MKGSYCALVTPMDVDGKIDEAVFQDLIEWQIASGISGVLVAGTTGEAPTLSAEEKTRLIRQTIQTVAKRVPVMVGCGTYSTAKTIALTQQAKALGADIGLVVTPYYNRPTQEGLYQHFRAITEAVDLPLILYNVPARTGCDLLPETMIRLSQFPGIVGIKDCSGKLDRVPELKAKCRENFLVFTGNDDNTFEFMQAGGDGLISAVANVVPQLVAALVTALLSKDDKTARALNEKVMPLNHALFLEPNPIAIKWALQYMKRIPAGIRLPLTPLSASYHEPVLSALKHAGVIS